MKDRTVELLHAISNRLSTRNDCKYWEYLVHIHEGRYNYMIEFEPYVRVYVDTHHRSKGNYVSVVECVLRKPKFSDVKFHKTKNGQIIVDEQNMFEPGIYLYRFSVSGKKRKWIRLR